MKNHSLLSLTVAFLAATLPPTAVGSYVQCDGDAVYVANSTFEANRDRLAAILPAEVSVAGNPHAYRRAVGYWPNRLMASLFCRRRDVDGTGYSSCAACIAGAFLEMERSCPRHREAFFSSRNCTLELAEFRIFGTGGNNGIYGRTTTLKQALASGLIFQAIGFAWLFFLLLQEWRSRKRVSS